MKDVERYNKGFGKWETIKKIELTPDEWTVDAGHLTPTMKLKRKVVQKIYIDLYNKIYE
jgi:long-chain acyl-CoA synthetase